MKKKVLALSLVLLMLLGACSAPKYSSQFDPMGDLGFGVPQAYDRENNQVELPMASPEEGSNQSDSNVERLVIKTAHMRVSVADPEVAMQTVTQLAKRFGGFVVNSESTSASQGSGGYKGASISIRVPTDKLDEAMQAIRELAANGKDGVLSESVSGEDVTSDYVDSQSRLRNLEAAEKQLVSLMENTTDLEQTMAVFRELTRTREQIEVTQGHIKYLKESAAMSMISASFVAEASLKPIEIGGWKPEGTAREAIQTLINFGQGLADFLIRFSIICLPFLIPLGIGLFFLIRALKKRRANKAARIASMYQTRPPQQEPPANAE